MNIFFIDAMFFIFTIFVFVKLCFYSWHEIRNESNLFGGICTIAITLASVIFVNIMVWIN